MPSNFDRPIGSRTDVKELEYIAALQQTGSYGTRKSGTISALDIVRYLRSRFGLVLDNEQAIDIVRHLGGGPLPSDVRDQLAENKLMEERERLYGELSSILLSIDELEQDEQEQQQKEQQQQQQQRNGTTETAAAPTGTETPNTRSSNNRKRAIDSARRNQVIKMMRSMDEMAIVWQTPSSSLPQQHLPVVMENYDDDDDDNIMDNGDVVTSAADGDNDLVMSSPTDDVVAEAEAEAATNTTADMDLNGQIPSTTPPTMMDNLNTGITSPSPMMGSIMKGITPTPISMMASTNDATHSTNSIMNSKRTPFYFGRNKTKKSKKRSQQRRDVARIEKALIDLNDMISEMQRPRMEYLDIAQLVSIVLIPTIARYVKQWNDNNNNDNNDNNHNTNNGIKNEGHDQGDVGIEILAMNELRNLTGNVGKQWTKLTAQVDDQELSLDPQPDHLLEFVLQKLCTMAAEDGEEHLEAPSEVVEDAHGNPYSSTSSSASFPQWGGRPPRVTYELVESLLVACGDNERAQNEPLIRAMVDIAKSPSGRLDELAFVNALSSDLKDWTPGVEDRESTYVYDVFGTEGIGTFHRLGGGTDTVIPPEHGTSEGDKSDRGISTNDAPSDVKLGPSINDSQTREVVGLPRPPSSRDIGNDPVDVNAEVERIPHIEEKGDSGDAMPQKDDAEDLENVPRTNNETSTSDEVQVQKAKSAVVIDYVLDSFGSLTVVILIWIVYLGQSLAYSSLIFSTNAFNITCSELNLPDGSFGCILVQTIVNWLTIALLLVAFGIVVLVPLSIGNHPTDRTPGRQIFSAFVTAIETFLPLTIVQAYRRLPQSDPPTETQQLVNDDNIIAALMVGMIMGSLLTVVYLFYAFVVRQKKRDHDFSNRPQLLSKLAQSSDEQGTAVVKRAGTRKVNKMLLNARRMHRATRTIGSKTNIGKSLTASKKVDLARMPTDQVFQTFVLDGEHHVPCCSWGWVFSRLLSRELFEVEGIWLPSRLWVFQVMQCLLLAVLFVLARIFIDAAVANANDSNDELPEGLPNWVYDLVPTGQQVEYAMVPSFWISFFVGVFIILLYIPSATSTVLKYRCGIYKSLGSNDFKIYRASVDNAYMNTANAVYGMLGAVVLFFLLFTLCIFLFIWEFSRSFMLTLLGWGIGLSVTIALKMILTTFCRRHFYRAFYRIEPTKMNISSLMLECWFIGLGGGVLVGRITQFLLAAAFWIGRIDEPFLAPNVGLLGYKFDYVPLNFVKDLLVHEAHRHPFIERIGAMYLMRLRYKDFGTEAGSAWRQLFVLALMPWLMKYRVSHEQRCKDSLSDLAWEREFEMKENLNPTEAVVERVKDTGVVDVGMPVVAMVGTVGKVVAVDAPVSAARAAKNIVDQLPLQTESSEEHQ